jgi:hypothetical protein
VYHTKFAATIIPAHLSAQFEGEGDSPEQARRSCERQLAAYLTRARLGGLEAELPVVKAFTCIDTDYENCHTFPRIAKRREMEKWEPKPRRGWISFFQGLFGGGVSLHTR